MAEKKQAGRPEHGALLSARTCAELVKALEGDPKAKALVEHVRRASGMYYTREERRRARALIAQAAAKSVDGETEVDDITAVSMGDDEGGYVQAWVWVDRPQELDRPARKAEANVREL